MKISYNWLKQFIKIDWEAAKTGELLTDLGLEVEGIDIIESIKGSLEGIVIGEVLTCVQHPNADRLKITTVDLGETDGNRSNCLWSTQRSSRAKSTCSHYRHCFI